VSGFGDGEGAKGGGRGMEGEFIDGDMKGVRI